MQIRYSVLLALFLYFRKKRTIVLLYLISKEDESVDPNLLIDSVVDDILDVLFIPH